MTFYYLVSNTRLISNIVGVVLLSWSLTGTSETRYVDDFCDFEKVPVNTAYKNTCSPVIFEDNFVGIKIVAPKSIKVSQVGIVLTDKHTNIPVSGYFNIGLAELVKDSNIKLIVENRETGKQYTGNIFDRNNAQTMANRAKEFGEKKLQEQSFGAYINPNLTKYVKIPNVTADYNVSVIMGKYESNTVLLKIDADSLDDSFTD